MTDSFGRAGSSSAAAQDQPENSARRTHHRAAKPMPRTTPALMARNNAMARLVADLAGRIGHPWRIPRACQAQAVHRGCTAVNDDGRFLQALASTLLRHLARVPAAQHPA